jgi:hypothetical protein
MVSLAELSVDRKPALPDAAHRQQPIEPTSLSWTNENGNSKVRKNSRRSKARRMFCSSQMVRRNKGRSSSARVQRSVRLPSNRSFLFELASHFFKAGLQLAIELIASCEVHIRFLVFALG